MNSLEDKFMAAIIAVCIAAFIGFIGFSLFDCNEQRRCEIQGNHVEHYNFHTVMMPMSCGKNCTMLVPVETSDLRCVR